MTMQQKRWKQLAWWVALFVLVLALYLFRYTGAPAANGSQQAASTSLHHINVVYALSFLGSSVARYSSVLPSVLLGILLCGIAGLATVRRYYSPKCGGLLLNCVHSDQRVRGLRLAIEFRSSAELLLRDTAPIRI